MQAFKLLILLRNNKYKILVSVLLITSGIFSLSHNYLFNLRSNSLPLGIYQKVNYQTPFAISCLTNKVAQQGLSKGYLSAGKCDTGIMPVMKQVLAKQGAVVSSTDAQLLINGNPIGALYKTVPFFQKSHAYRMGDDEYLLLSLYHERSWDSRYFGPVGIEFYVKPVLIWT